jgi:hypothetical protein
MENPLHELSDRLQRFQAMSVALGQQWGIRLQAAARTDAPWRDRTAHARQGMNGGVETGAGDIVAVIYLAHSVRYGVFLESGNKAYTIVPKTKKALFWNGLAHPVKKAFHPAREPIYAVIRPTVEKNLETIGQQFRELITSP